MGACSRLAALVGLFTAIAACAQTLPVTVKVVREPGGTREVEVANDSPVPVRFQLRGTGGTPVAAIVRPNEVVRHTLPATTERNMAWIAEPEPTYPAPVEYLLPFIGVAEVTQLPTCLRSHSQAMRHAVDFAMPEGTPVRAAREGTVLAVADGTGSPKGVEPSHQVQVLHADGTWAVYGHLRAQSLLVTSGQFVQAGELLAYSGNSGESTGPHLHFAVHYLRNGVPDTLPVGFTKSLNCGRRLTQD